MSYTDTVYSTQNTVENTKAFTQRVLTRNVPGAFVECGVAAGAQLAAMQDVVQGMGQSRWIYGFDSFEGTAYKILGNILVSSGARAYDQSDVRANLDRWTGGKSNTIVLVKGRFQNTVHRYRPVFQQLGGIALLRIDDALYESTRICLETLFPHVNEGGIIMIDDWNHPGCRKACLEYFTLHAASQIAPPHGTAEGGPAYFVKRSVPALAYRLNIYSQNGEDGIVAELLRRLPETSGWACEFGAWDGKQYSNTFALVERGFKAVYIEGREDYYQDLLKTCASYPSITPVHAMVGYEGDSVLDNILAGTDIPKDFDILSIDIDSYDYQVWRAVKEYMPRIVIIEINSSISPLDTTHIHGPGKQGTGFAPMLALGQSKGYTLVCHTGNLIFVRNDLAPLCGELVIEPTECHRSPFG